MGTPAAPLSSVPDFEFPDWSAPLDVAARVAAAPDDGTVRGMFFQQIADALGDRLPDGVSDRYTAFGNYPLRGYMELLAEAARVLHPQQTVREGLRRLGQQVYPMFASTMVGSAIFAVAGHDFGKVASLASKAYGVSISPGRLSTIQVAPAHLRVQMIDIWSFPASFQYGVFEGAMEQCGVTGRIRVAQHSPSAADFDIQW